MAWRAGLTWAGIAAGPGAWAVSTQANYALSPWPWAHRLAVVPIVAAVLTVIALAGAALSWRALTTHAVSTQQFVALGVLAGLLFAAVIALHGVAGMVLG
jgi:hypothetical protein